MKKNGLGALLHGLGALQIWGLPKAILACPQNKLIPSLMLDSIIL